MSTEFIRYAAKAIAALVMPWVLFVAAWAADNLGLEINVDPGAIEVAVVSVITALVVYFKRNTAPSNTPSTEPPGD